MERRENEEPEPEPAPAPQPAPPPDLEIEPATSADDAKRAKELIREHQWDDLRRDE